MTGTAERERPSGHAKRVAGWIAAVIVLLTASIVLPFPASSSGAATAARKSTVKITTGPLGRVLVNAKGQALYVDAHDRLSHLDCTGNCTKAWPPLLLARGVKRAVAGPGVKDLGTVVRPDHRLQVTSHNRPLYLYAGDGQPGQFHGQGLHDTFFVATPSGEFRPAPTPVTPPTPAPTMPAPSPNAPPTTTPPGMRTPVTTPLATSPSPTSPPTTTPPGMRTPVTNPPVTSPPPTPPPTTAPVGGGVAY
jgi:predicted lipoprotein with Yx(FWY)xxD motif